MTARIWKHGIVLFALVSACGRSPFSGNLATRGVPTARAHDSRAVVELGSDLFVDRRLSRDGTVSCASCHVPTNAFAEDRAVAEGIGVAARMRNTPTILNVGFNRSFDWDGRTATLESQIEGVFASDGDAGIDIIQALSILNRDARYVQRFRQAFGRAPTVDDFTHAIAAFERSLIAADSRFDRFYFRGDSAALTASERRGWEVFRSGQAGCAGCHAPLASEPSGQGAALFTDQRFHNLGVGYAKGRMNDWGRYGVTANPTDMGAFKTPGLRNVALTAPYMHDGSLRTLEEVVAFYNRGGIPNPNIDPTIMPRGLSAAQEADLVAFLRSLTSENLAYQARTPRTPQ